MRSSATDCLIMKDDLRNPATAILTRAEFASVNSGDFTAFDPHGLKLLNW